MQNRTIFVGCGGSGITTLQRVNELLAGNPKTRPTLREDVSYIIVDTSVSETETFKENIRNQMGSAGMPVITIVQVTKSFTNLNSIVQPNFDKFAERIKAGKVEDGPSKLRRLQENWWYTPDHDMDGERCEQHPFRAQNIRESLEKGAGQCGPVSFLATWNYLDRLEQDITDHLEQIQRRNPDVNNPLENINLFIVAGTAGGTGRGCWQLIAFKMRQTLKKLGHEVEPVGIFFDSTCFHNVSKGSPVNRLNTSLNSLTGMSELSAWMQLPNVSNFRFRLPDLHDPDPEPDPNDPMGYESTTDVIVVGPDETNGKSPVSEAYLIFGNNGVAPLKDNAQYHEMAAAALYAKIAEDKFIGPGEINHHENVKSLGALTFEVETIPIRRYLESLVRCEFSKSLCRDASGDSSLETEADLIVGRKGVPDAEKISFFARTNFMVDENLSTTPLSPVAPKKPTLLQRVMATAAKKLKWSEDTSCFENATEEFLTALNEQDIGGVADTVDDLMALEKFDADAVVKEVLKTYGLAVEAPEVGSRKPPLDGLRQKIDETVMVSFAGKGLGREDKSLPDIGRKLKPSVGRVQAVVAKLKARLEDSRRNLLGDVDNGGEPLSIMVGDGNTVKSIDECATLFIEGPVRKAAEKKFWEVKPFTKAEIKSLEKKFQDYYLCAVFFKVSSSLAKRFREGIAMLDQIGDSLKTLVKGLEDTGKSFKNDLCATCNVEDPDLAYERLFVDEEDTAVFDSLPRADSFLNVFRRVLKPIMSLEKVEALVGDPDCLNIIETPIRRQLKKEIEKLVAGDVYVSDDDARTTICKEFKELIAANVTLAAINGVDFMTQHFSFEKILKNNIKHWNDLLKNRAGDQDMLALITDRFRILLGIDRFEKDDNNFPRIDFSSLWRNIIVSMVGACRPWIRLNARAKPTYLETIALMPTLLLPDEVEQCENEVDAKFKRKVDIYHLGARERGGDTLPKDRIVVFSAMAVRVADEENAFDYISSLDYWKEAEFARCLREAEDVDGRAYFHANRGKHAQIKWGENIDTHGFVSPQFVREIQLAAHRWRPWDPFKDDFGTEHEAEQAMLYGLLGNGAVSDDARKAVEDLGWTGFPLIVLGADKNKKEALTFTRECRDDITSWKTKGWALGNTIDAALRYLKGEGRTGDESLGEAFEKQQKEGERIRRALLDEHKKFLHVFDKISGAHQKEIITALENWLGEQANKASGKYKDAWTALYHACQATHKS